MASYKTNNDLFHLVKGLSGHEKAYYKKMARRHASQTHTHHLDLFELLDRSASYDDKILQQHIGINSQAQFSSLKSYLGKDILDTIVFLKRNDDVNTQLQFWLNQLEALLQKRLLQLARKLFKKAWELAVQYEHYDAQIRLLQIQAKMLEYRSYKEYKQQAAHIATLLQQTLEHQHRQQQILFYLEQLNATRKLVLISFEEGHTAEVQFIKDKLLQLSATGSESKCATILYHNALALCDHMLLEFASCNEHCGKMLELLQEEPRFINVFPAYFLSATNITFYNLFAQQQVSEVARHLDAYRALASQYIASEHHRKQWEIIEFNTTLKIHHKTAHYDAVTQLVADRSNYIIDCAAQVLPRAEVSYILSSICISYFVLGDWKKAANLMIDVKEINHEIGQEDILYFTTIFQLLILYEQKEWYQLTTAIEAAYHALYAHKKLRKFEKELMLFLKRLSAIRVQQYVAEHIHTFLGKLDQYKNDPVKKLYFLYFNYYGWLESKAQNIAYRAYMEQKLQDAHAQN